MQEGKPMNIYDRLQEMGLSLPEPPPSGGIYKPVREAGGMLYVSGQGPTLSGAPIMTGKLGAERSIEDGQACARQCVLNALSVLQAHLGDLARIKGLVKLLGFVQSAPGFQMQPRVMDGASQLLKDLLGEAGVGARSAIGVNELPGGIPVEIEFIFEI